APSPSPSRRSSEERSRRPADQIEQPAGRDADGERQQEQRHDRPRVSRRQARHRRPSFRQGAEKGRLDRAQVEAGGDDDADDDDRYENRPNPERAKKDLKLGRKMGEARQAEGS